jgi:hypothetical protein
MGYIIYIDQRAKVIWVQVPDDANAFTIFETLNDRGLDLAVSDLLKNYHLGNSQNRMNEVLTRWVAMIGALEAVDSEALVVPYIRQLWASEYGVTREKELYKKMKEQIAGKQKAVDFAGKLETNARLYAAILNPVHEVWNIHGPTASGHMRTLNELRMEQIRPLLLAVLDTFETGEVQKSLRLMVSYRFPRNTSGIK